MKGCSLCSKSTGKRRCSSRCPPKCPPGPRSCTMWSIFQKPNAAAVQLSPEDVRQFLYREARFLDNKEWENWLALYAPNVEFWMPSWDDDDQLVTDPHTQISLIWYGNNGGLADPVLRLVTEPSSP